MLGLVCLYVKDRAHYIYVALELRNLLELIEKYEKKDKQPRALNVPCKQSVRKPRVFSHIPKLRFALETYPFQATVQYMKDGVPSGLEIQYA